MGDWLEPIVKWGVILVALFGGFALQRTRARKAGNIEERLRQAKEGDRAQERQLEAMRLASDRDLLDDLKRVRDKYRG